MNIENPNKTINIADIEEQEEEKQTDYDYGSDEKEFDR